MMRRATFLFVTALLLAACAKPAPAPVAQATPTAPPQPTATAQPTATPEPTAPPQPTAAAQPAAAPWWTDAVFYEIYVRSFYDGNGDGIGDFKGLTAKLDYLNDGDPSTHTDLGVTALYLMPIHPATSPHGYDVLDYRAVSPDLGSLDDFRQFLGQAHQRGIRVIIDYVLNHTSIDHPWFVASRDPKSDQRDWYVWSATHPGYVGPWGETVWNPDGGAYYYSVFWQGQPDLNYRNPAVSREMQDTARFWLQDIGVDGLRLDAARYLIEDGKDKLADTPETVAWYRQFHSFYTQVRSDAYAIGEVTAGADALAPYVQPGGLEQVFQFDLASAYMSGVNNRDGREIAKAMASNLARVPPDRYGIFLTNHDQNRVMSQFVGDVGKARSAAALYLTAPGTPFIYYGEEIGMIGSKPDPNLRKPMQWTSGDNAGFTTGKPWIDLTPDYATRNVAAQSADPASLLSLYRRLISLRAAHPALRTGDYFPVASASSSVYAALRATQDEVMLVVLNLNNRATSQYSLTLDLSPLRGRYTAQLVLTEGAGRGAAPGAELVVTGRGGFEGYRPLPELAPGASYVFELKVLQ